MLRPDLSSHADGTHHNDMLKMKQDSRQPVLSGSFYLTWLAVCIRQTGVHWAGAACSGPRVEVEQPSRGLAATDTAQATRPEACLQ